MYKSTIRKFIEENSLGITDLEKYYELMKHSNIVDKITAKTVSFSEKIVKIDSLNNLRKTTANFFLRNQESTSIMSYY